MFKLVLVSRGFHYEPMRLAKLIRIRTELISCSEERSPLAQSSISHPAERLDGDSERVSHQFKLTGDMYLTQLFSRAYVFSSLGRR